MPKLSPLVTWTPELPHPIRVWLDDLVCDWRFRHSGTRGPSQNSWRWLAEQKVMPTGSLEAGWSYLLGLWEHSHQISQDLPDAQGAFWHGCLHRQEGDHGNASYWFKRVQGSGLLEELGGVMANKPTPHEAVGVTGGLLGSGRCYDPAKLWGFSKGCDSATYDEMLWLEWQGAMSWFWKNAKLERH